MDVADLRCRLIIRGEVQLLRAIDRQILRAGIAGPADDVEPAHAGRVETVEFGPRGGTGRGEIEFLLEDDQLGRVRERDGSPLRGILNADRRARAGVNPQPRLRPVRRGEIQLVAIGHIRQHRQARWARVRGGSHGVEIGHQTRGGRNDFVEFKAGVAGTCCLGRNHQPGAERSHAVEVRHGGAPGRGVEGYGVEHIRRGQSEQSSRGRRGGRPVAGHDEEAGPGGDELIEVRAGHHTDGLRGPGSTHLEEQVLADGFRDVVERPIEADQSLGLGCGSPRLADIGNAE